MNIYVGNLALETAEPELRQSFEKFGEVSRVNIVMDKVDGKSRGFGFVEMPSNLNAQAAILGLHGKDLGGRSLNINEAHNGNGKGTEAVMSTAIAAPKTEDVRSLNGNKVY